jgi:carbon monoxide dehydrogenase subunit G
MILDNQFSLPLAMEDAFDALVDPALVLPSLSGARRGASVDDRTVRGELRLEVGSLTIPYRGTLRVDERDREAGALRLSVEAREGRGKGTARGRVEIRLRESGEATRVAVRSELEVEGRAERAGEEAVRAAVAALVDELAAGLAARVQAAPTAPRAPALREPDPAPAPASPAAAPAPPPPRDEQPAPVPGRVRIMTTEPIPAASVAPRDSLAETLAARPWLVPLVVAGLLLLAVAVVRRRRG